MERDPSIGSGCWYLGQIYFNRDDKRIIVRKKWGYGWTMNFARPLAIPMLILVCTYAGAPAFLLLYFDVESPRVCIAAYAVMLFSLIGFCFWMEKRASHIRS